MIHRGGPMGLVDKFSEMSSRKKLGVALVLLLVVVAIVAGARLGLSADPGEVEDPFASEEPLATLSWDDQDPSGADTFAASGPSADEIAAEIAQAVEATVIALQPTATPEPTPDVAATVQASIGESRDSQNPSMSANPLDSDAPRNPYLTPYEVEILSAMGPVLWYATDVYLRVSEVTFVEFADLERGEMSAQLNLVELSVDRMRDLESRNSRRPEAISEVVSSFLDFVDGGVRSVQAAATDLEGAVRVLEVAEADKAASLETGDREQLWSHYTGMQNNLQRFYEVMSSYGCSACGELYRYGVAGGR